MFTLIKQGDTTAYGISQFIVDTPADIADLPTDVKIHSIALCILTGKYYFLSNGRKEYVTNPTVRQCNYW